jgi:response regulator RpfG family c-di-GMP phosphodiesterase
MAIRASFANGVGEIRSDESEIRLVFVEQSRDYADLVRETLESTSKGHFQVRNTDRLEAALHDVEEGACDAVLVDLTEGTDRDANPVSIDAASSLAIRVPVIVLTGSDDDEKDLEPVEDARAVFRSQMAHSPIPGQILRAVRRHRRLGSCGAADPIVLRDPLRAFARAFAKLRRTLTR